jgi:hypothetical protein
MHATSVHFHALPGMRFDAFEIHTILKDSQGEHQLCHGDAIPEDADVFFTLFGHVSGEGLHSIADNKDFAPIQELALDLGAKPCFAAA